MQKFLIFDIDHTISTFDHESGMENMRRHILGTLDNTLTQKICDFMDRCYAAFSAKAKGIESADAVQLAELINDAAKNVEGGETFSDFRWSRELWVYMIGGGALSPAFAVKAAAYFWQGVAKHAKQYEDAARFFRWLNTWPSGYNYSKAPNERWKTIFVTSSDARLNVNHDNTKLLYDADYSKKRKAGRIIWTIPSSRFGSTVFIGDPISKPHPQFWQMVLANIGYIQGEDIAIMTGDSPRSDLSGLDKFDIIPILIDRDGNFAQKEVPQAKYRISALTELPEIMMQLEKSKTGGS